MTVPAGPDYGAQIQAGVDAGTGILTDNVIALFALPVIWVGYKVARKVLGKVG